MSRSVPLVVLIFQYIALYGLDAFIGPWDTTDKVVPAKLFYVALRCMPQARAMQVYDHQRATAMAILAGLGQKSASSLLDELIEEAFPEEV